jgi:hypothetical protein
MFFLGARRWYLPFTHLSMAASRRRLFDAPEMAASEVEESSEDVTSSSKYTPRCHE